MKSRKLTRWLLGLPLAVLVMFALLLVFANDASAQGSSGSYGSAVNAGYGSSGQYGGQVFGTGRFRVFKRIHANRVAKGTAWGYQSHASYQSNACYGSTGSLAPEVSADAPDAGDDTLSQLRDLEKRLMKLTAERDQVATEIMKIVAAHEADRITASPITKPKRLTFASVAADLMKLKENPLDRVDPGRNEAIQLVSR